MWLWRIVHVYVWRQGVKEHINVLEARAALNAVRWRLRTQSSHGKRWLHLVDSQVTAGVLTKGRSSAAQLRRVVRRWNSLMMATNSHPMVGYVASEDNPADVPSRWATKKKLKVKFVPSKALFGRKPRPCGSGL